jgi:hypothetical protein
MRPRGLFDVSRFDQRCIPAVVAMVEFAPTDTYL